MIVRYDIGNINDADVNAIAIVIHNCNGIVLC